MREAEAEVRGQESGVRGQRQLELTIFRGDGRALHQEAGNGLSAEMGLGRFYRLFIKPVVLVPRGTAAGTFREYEQSLKYWMEFTGDPPLGSIDKPCCAEFVGRMQRELLGRRGGAISNNTIRKHCRQLQRLLDLAGPEDRKHRSAAELLDRVPYLERPPEQAKPPVDGFTLQEISQWLGACGLGRVPRIPGVTAAAWWYSLVLFVYNTGLRIDSVMRSTWQNIRGPWLSIPPKDIKRRRRGIKIYLNQPAQQAIKKIRRSDKRLFVWPHKMTHLQRVRRGLLTETEIAVERRFGFAGLRKTLLTFLASVNPAVAKLQAGHSLDGDVLLKHYVHPEMVAEVMDRVPQPPRPDRQMRLF